MKLYDYKSEYSETIKVFLKLTHYVFGGGIAIHMICDCFEPWGTATVNIEGFPLEQNEIILDTNNMPNIEGFMVKNDIALPVERYAHSGFCVYPVYVLNPKWIKEMEEDNE